MAATLVKHPDGTYALQLEQADRCHLIPMHPREMPASLRSGRWLILLVAVWSAPDLQEIPKALALAGQLRDGMRLAIGPFDSHSEVRQWCAAVSEQLGSPLWLFLNDGILKRELVGIYTEERLRATAEEIFG